MHKHSNLIGSKTPSRTFALPSCGACMRIAERKGITHGYTVTAGTVEGFTHAGGQTHALITTNEGYIIPVSIDQLLAERQAIITALSLEVQ